MKRYLLWAAVLTAVLSVALWTALGANRGWTKTSVPVRTLDPVTGLESVDYRPKFLPGVELLAAALATASGLAAVSFFIRTSTKANS